MTTDLYLKLRKHLDDLPGGYPATETGVELRILKRMFTPEEAELAATMRITPESPADIGALDDQTGAHAELAPGVPEVEPTTCGQPGEAHRPARQ